MFSEYKKLPRRNTEYFYSISEVIAVYLVLRFSNVLFIVSCEVRHYQKLVM